jgi:hypothetical protein
MLRALVEFRIRGVKVRMSSHGLHIVLIDDTSRPTYLSSSDFLPMTSSLEEKLGQPFVAQFRIISAPQ